MAARKILFPYLNTSPVSLKKEKWKDIPGYEYYYQVSNYGRVKALARTVLTESGKIYHYQEKMRKILLRTAHNKTVNEPLFRLSISLCKENHVETFNIARLVYTTFVKPIDLRDHSTLIAFKDNDARNVHVSNLMKSNNLMIRKRTTQLGRFKGQNPKPITQFDLNGMPTKQYASIWEAAQKTGLNNRGISIAASGKIHMFHGFFWRFGTHTKPIRLDAITKRKKPKNFIHESLQKKLGIKKINPDKIPPYLNLSTKSMKGERWKDVSGYEGLYQVSSLGRVKALQKITFGNQQKWRPEQIQRIIVDFRTRDTGKKYVGITLVNMAKYGSKRLVSVARWVYYQFVKKFDIADPTVKIAYKDGNPLNTYFKNLLIK
jgi:NUMOD4 motif